MYYFKKFCYWFIVLFIHVNIEVYVCMYIYNNNKKYNKNILKILFMYFPIYKCTHVHTSTYLRVNNNNYYNNKNTQLKKNHIFYLFVEFFTCVIWVVYLLKKAIFEVGLHV